jgi:hypothetical protein
VLTCGEGAKGEALAKSICSPFANGAVRRTRRQSRVSDLPVTRTLRLCAALPLPCWKPSE